MDQPKCAVITGAAQSIGRRTAGKFAEAGYRLALIDIRMPESALDSLRSLGAEAFGHAGDITDENTVQQFAAEVQNHWQAADVLVNNAGISFIAPAESISGVEYRRVLEVNLVAPFLLAKAFGAQMLAAKRGSRRQLAIPPPPPPLTPLNAS